MSPVVAIQVDMNETPVGRDVAHLDHGVVSESVRHIGSPRGHVVGTAAEIDDIELISGREVFIFETIEDGIL